MHTPTILCPSYLLELIYHSLTSWSGLNLHSWVIRSLLKSTNALSVLATWPKYQRFCTWPLLTAPHKIKITANIVLESTSAGNYAKHLECVDSIHLYTALRDGQYSRSCYILRLCGNQGLEAVRKLTTLLLRSSLQLTLQLAGGSGFKPTSVWLRDGGINSQLQ